MTKEDKLFTILIVSAFLWENTSLTIFIPIALDVRCTEEILCKRLEDWDFNISNKLMEEIKWLNM